MEAAVGAVRAYFTPTVVVLGLLGNGCILAIFCLEARLSRWNRFGVYCVALAISDSSILVSNGLLDDFLGRGLAFASGGRVAVKLDTLSSLTCKLMEYLPHVFFFTSTYLLLAFTVDRLLTICLPLRFISHHHVRATVLLVLGTFATGFVLMLPTVFVHEIQDADVGVAGRKCLVVSVNGSHLACTMLYFKSFGVFVCPFLLQLALCCAIVAKLLRVRGRRQALLPSQQETQLEMSRFYAHLAVTVAYCLLVAPLCVVIVLRIRCGQPATPDPEYQVFLGHLSRLLDSVKDVNYAVNFWVYLVFVRSFRKRCRLAVSYLCVRARCAQLCPQLPTAQKAVSLVDAMNRKRRPTLFCVTDANRRATAAHDTTAHDTTAHDTTLHPV